MKSTRTINATLKNKTIVTEKIEPTNALFVRPTRCEEQSAHILNEANSAIERENVQETRYRLKQSQSGEWRSIFEALFYSVEVCVLVVLLSQLKDKALEDQNKSAVALALENIRVFAMAGLTVYAVYRFFCIPTATANAFRYHYTKNKCKDWLERRLETETVGKLADSDYSHRGDIVSRQV